MPHRCLGAAPLHSWDSGGPACVMQPRPRVPLEGPQAHDARMKQLSAFAALVALGSPLVAQDTALRAELAWRTRALERAWMTTEERALREQALPLVEEAVQRFFRLDGRGVGENLSAAEARLRGEEAGPLAGLRLHPAVRLQDAAAPEVELVFGWLFGDPSEEELLLEVRCGNQLLEGPSTVRLDPEAQAASWTGRWPEVDERALGDLRLEIVVRSGESRAGRSLSFSRVERLAPRLDGLRAFVEEREQRGAAPSIEGLTLAARVELLESLAEGSREETDFPAARLLAEAEALAASLREGATWCDRSRRGQHWWTVPAGRGTAPLRLLVPQAYDPDQPPPVVVALHGAGGSENMFFDSYGDGRIVELCEERGWLLVAPRVSPFGAPVEAILESLTERLPFDAERVLLVGHSMGAGAGQRLLQRAPERYAAFVAMGGGSRVRDAGKLADEPVLVAAGDRDFGRPGAEALHASLVAAGSERARLVIAPACEHLLIVADVLPEAFDWLDEALGG